MLFTDADKQLIRDHATLARGIDSRHKEALVGVLESWNKWAALADNPEGVSLSDVREAYVAAVELTTRVLASDPKVVRADDDSYFYSDIDAGRRLTKLALLMNELFIPDVVAGIGKSRTKRLTGEIVQGGLGAVAAIASFFPSVRMVLEKAAESLPEVPGIGKLDAGALTAAGAVAGVGAAVEAGGDIEKLLEANKPHPRPIGANVQSRITAHAAEIEQGPFGRSRLEQLTGGLLVEDAQQRAAFLAVIDTIARDSSLVGVDKQIDVARLAERLSKTTEEVSATLHELASAELPKGGVLLKEGKGGTFTLTPTGVNSVKMATLEASQSPSLGDGTLGRAL